jgi:hypothetical protein
MVEENPAPWYDGGQSSFSQGMHGEQLPFQIKDHIVKILKKDATV